MPATKLIVWMIASSLMLLLAACGASQNTSNSSGSSGAATTGQAAAPAVDGAAAVRAVTTTSIIADLVQNVGGDRVTTRALLPPGTDPHTYSPSPSDVQAITAAQIVFRNGLGLDASLDEVIQNAGGNAVNIAVTNGITPIAGATEATSDPHMWFDVQNAIRYTETIRDSLKQVDPQGAGTYDTNAAAYIDQLKQLDAEIVQQISTIPPDRRKLVTNHDTFGYFAKRYGFEIIGSVFENVSTEQEPSAQQIAELVRLIRAQNVPAIFTENTVNARLAQQVAAEAGIQVVTNLYTDALGEPGSDGDTYIKMMRYDVQQIVAALK